MLDELRDELRLVLLVNVAPSEEEILRKGNRTSICISYDSPVTDDNDPGGAEPGFRNHDDFQIVRKYRADLIFFGSNTSRVAMEVVLRDFLQNDGIIVLDAGPSSISRIELAGELPTLGCGDGRVFTLRRLPGTFAVGYEVGADLVTRVYGKLACEFFEALGRVVVGAEVLVDGRFKKPEGLVGPYFIVAVEGAQFGYRATSDDRDLVAADLSSSGIRTLCGEAFYRCGHLAAVAFPSELENIGGCCFRSCGALHVVNLVATQLKTLGAAAFSGCGVTRASVPASLRVVDAQVFCHTPLEVLDLSACGGVRVKGPQTNSLVELSLPRDGCTAAVTEFLRGSRIGIL
jgi:hypothetical protein